MPRWFDVPKVARPPVIDPYSPTLISEAFFPQEPKPKINAHNPRTVARDLIFLPLPQPADRMDPVRTFRAVES
jgi:hypothetical protein